MNIKIISCKIFYREIAWLTALSEHYFDVTFLRQGLHAQPKKLGEMIQAELDAVSGGADIHTNYPPDGAEFDAILLGYALCSNCVDGLVSARYPMVIPKAHDCISLFLGSRERYADYFFANKGTFWCNISWAENSFIPDERHREAELTAIKKRRGEAAALRLAEASEQWKAGYERMTFIRRDEFSGTAVQAAAEARCRLGAEYNGWAFDVLDGDGSYMRDFLGGNWDGDRFLVVPPERRVVLTYDERLIDYER
ncbi:MAG: DUF1638 domain-containing protein [Oscillospiraceae bacterium]|jgi:hypothetical protein|nr:DUF1638 domain-containing protein [Oscillospiraceae bacterium]